MYVNMYVSKKEFTDIRIYVKNVYVRLSLPSRTSFPQTFSSFLQQFCRLPFSTHNFNRNKSSPFFVGCCHGKKKRFGTITSFAMPQGTGARLAEGAAKPGHWIRARNHLSDPHSLSESLFSSLNSALVRAVFHDSRGSHFSGGQLC